MLIKVAHLQPIKELLSFIKVNLLKHAVQDIATSKPCHTRLPLTPLLCRSLVPDWWMVPGQVILSGRSVAAFG